MTRSLRDFRMRKATISGKGAGEEYRCRTSMGGRKLTNMAVTNLSRVSNEGGVICPGLIWNIVRDCQAVNGKKK